jgi:hypothetical protein
MARTTQKLRRLTGVFHDLETVERARVGELAQEMTALREAQEEIFRRLDEPSSLHGPFMALMSSHIGRLDRRLQRVAREHEIALKRYTEAAARGRSARQLLADAVAEETRKREQRDLEALLEFQEAIAAQGRGKSPSSS